ncbi:phytoene/squalene synthase family protein [Lacihabitans sp. LS3-19]|uniref:phytoene/squalene synthase family protein n=1 Tax=Lacihabitans sp. LS3-19 TaxID=2487335 RepID=UPI0020CF7524|nr:phytoene/squalene synthase family protein [Lacihabitans sp. LS3-19]MCP9766564.1 phytoene/squalene synthase family protein [Lacihabitans sp. LS3-19]
MFELFEKSTFGCSKLVTELYSTSFSMGIKTLAKRFREPIYGIYGFVRFADEIVDTFHEFDKKYLLDKFKADTYEAIKMGISLNPILHSFQKIVHEYKIEHELIDAFLYSMEMDLGKVIYDDSKYKEYIYGSAEVVGLMCLKVFVEGNQEEYEKLKGDARSLGAAFQKVNFLRDIKSDFQERGRVYFPQIDMSRFSAVSKKEIEKDIQKDFDDALRGILNLPVGARSGVYLAYVYYLKLFKRIKNTSAEKIQEQRIRVPDFVKFTLLAKTLVKGSLGVL